jgi:hypothetical protein
MYLRYLIWDEFGECIRKMASRIECEPYLRHGCTLTVLPRVKQPTAAQKFDGVLQLLGSALF